MTTFGCWLRTKRCLQSEILIIMIITVTNIIQACHQYIDVVFNNCHQHRCSLIKFLYSEVPKTMFTYRRDGENGNERIRYRHNVSFLGTDSSFSFRYDRFGFHNLCNINYVSYNMINIGVTSIENYNSKP